MGSGEAKLRQAEQDELIVKGRAPTERGGLANDSLSDLHSRCPQANFPANRPSLYPLNHFAWHARNPEISSLSYHPLPNHQRPTQWVCT